MSLSRFPQITDELLSAYLDGLVTDDERQLIERALTEDAEIAWRLESLRQTVQLLQSMPALALPKSFTLDATLVEAFEAREKKHERATVAVATTESRQAGWWQRLQTALRGQQVVLRNLGAIAAILVAILLVRNQLRPSPLDVSPTPELAQSSAPVAMEVAAANRATATQQAATTTDNRGPATVMTVAETRSQAEEAAVDLPPAAKRAQPTTTTGAMANVNEDVNEDVNDSSSQNNADSAAAEQGAQAVTTSPQEAPTEAAPAIAAAPTSAAAPAADGFTLNSTATAERTEVAPSTMQQGFGGPEMPPGEDHQPLNPSEQSENGPIAQGVSETPAAGSNSADVQDSDAVAESNTAEETVTAAPVQEEAVATTIEDKPEDATGDANPVAAAAEAPHPSADVNEDNVDEDGAGAIANDTSPTEPELTEDPESTEGAVAMTESGSATASATATVDTAAVQPTETAQVANAGTKDGDAVAVASLRAVTSDTLTTTGTTLAVAASLQPTTVVASEPSTLTVTMTLSTTTELTVTTTIVVSPAAQAADITAHEEITASPEVTVTAELDVPLEPTAAATATATMTATETAPPAASTPATTTATLSTTVGVTPTTPRENRGAERTVTRTPARIVTPTMLQLTPTALARATATKAVSVGATDSDTLTATATPTMTTTATPSATVTATTTLTATRTLTPTVTVVSP